MDLGKFATRENCEKGVWAEPVIFGQETGIELCLLGRDSDTARKFGAQQLRDLQAMTEAQRARVNAVQRNRDEIVVRTVGIRVKGDIEEKLPVTIDGREIEKTPAGYNFLYEQITELESWAREYSNTRPNYLPKQKQDLNKQSDDSSIGTTPTASEPEKKGA
jgi:hypothetical protein